MLMFGAKDFQLRQWTVTDPQGYDTTVAVYNLDAKPRPTRTCSASTTRGKFSSRIPTAVKSSCPACAGIRLGSPKALHDVDGRTSRP